MATGQANNAFEMTTDVNEDLPVTICDRQTS